MKNFKFILLCTTIAVMTTGLVGCKKGVYDEKQALDAQKSLLEYKYAQETDLEKLRQSGASALEQLKYQFAVKTLVAGDSIKDASLRKRDIVILVKDPITTKPVAGATVTIPTLIGTVLTSTSDSLGYAYFPASKNINVPFPASAIVSKTGYASGSVSNSITGLPIGVLDNNSITTYGGYYVYGNSGGNSQTGPTSGLATIYILNTASSPNTLKGKVYIENDLTNTASEFASKALVSVFTNFNGDQNNGQSQKFEWSTITDSAGNYSISLPDLSTNLNFSYTTIEGNTKLFVNSIAPGFDTLPSVKTIPATYYLGTNQNNGSMPENNSSSYFVPTSITRFHAITPSADSNGRKYYIKNILLTEGADLGGSTNALTFSSRTNLGSTQGLTYYNEDGTSLANTATARYLAAKAIVDTAVLYDAFANADNYIKTNPVLEFNYTLYTDPAGNKSVLLNSLTQKTAGVINKVNGAIYKTSLLNSVYTNSYSNNTGSYITSNIFNQYSSYLTGFYSISSNYLKGGKTYVQNLTYGVGKLKTTVR